MAKLRHIALVVRDLEKSAQFYEQAFGMTRVGRDDLAIGSGIYLSDGVVNLALLQYTSAAAAGVESLDDLVGAHHFGFVVDNLDEAQQKVEAAGAKFFFDLGKSRDDVNFERKYKDPDGIVFDLSEKGWLGNSGV
jgi:catechol 2,3-dioxygenase-like lactoylglutathione lyase family enzyme